MKQQFELLLIIVCLEASVLLYLDRLAGHIKGFWRSPLREESVDENKKISSTNVPVGEQESLFPITPLHFRFACEGFILFVHESL